MLNNTTRRAAIAGAVAAVATVGAIPYSTARAMRAAADPNDVDTMLKALATQFIADAKLIDPSIEGAWLCVDHTLENRDAAPQMICFERAGSPFITRTMKDKANG